MADIQKLDVDYKRQLERTRDEVIPRILELFAAYEVHATWATVGILFCRTPAELEAARPEVEPTYDDPALSSYGYLADLGAGEAEDPWRFAPSIVQQLASTPGQEVGSHSFSHFYCLEPGATDEAFAADLEAWSAAAASHGLTGRSICFGRNQYGHGSIEVSERAGFTAYRGAEPAWCYRPTPAAGDSIGAKLVRRADAYLPLFGHHCRSLSEVGATYPYNVGSSRFFRASDSRLRWLEPLKQRRIRNGLDRAAKTARVFHLWWHPQDFAVDPDTDLAALQRILQHFDGLRRSEGMISANMSEVAERAAALPSSARAPESTSGWTK